MELQYIIVALIFLACIGYVGRRIANIIRNAGNPCHACKLHTACGKKRTRQWQPPKQRDHCFTPENTTVGPHTSAKA